MLAALIRRAARSSLSLADPHSLPYGLLVNSQGVPFFAEFGANKIARVDPATMGIEEFTLPNADARPRRIAVTSDDAIWYTDYARGYLGRLDPKTGRVSEWPSPAGPIPAPMPSPSSTTISGTQEMGNVAEHTGALRSQK